MRRGFALNSDPVANARAAGCPSDGRPTAQALPRPGGHCPGGVGVGRAGIRWSAASSSGPGATDLRGSSASAITGGSAVCTRTRSPRQLRRAGRAGRRPITLEPATDRTKRALPCVERLRGGRCGVIFAERRREQGRRGPKRSRGGNIGNAFGRRASFWRRRRVPRGENTGPPAALGHPEAQTIDGKVATAPATRSGSRMNTRARWFIWCGGCRES